MKTPREMSIGYDLGCMPEAKRRAMEDALLALLHEHGWSMWASGADVEERNGMRVRDIALQHCPDTECEHWDGHSGCDVSSAECVKETA